MLQTRKKYEEKSKSAWEKVKLNGYKKLRDEYGQKD